MGLLCGVYLVWLATHTFCVHLHQHQKFECIISFFMWWTKKFDMVRTSFRKNKCSSTNMRSESEPPTIPHRHKNPQLHRFPILKSANQRKSKYVLKNPNFGKDDSQTTEMAQVVTAESHICPGLRSLSYPTGKFHVLFFSPPRFAGISAYLSSASWWRRRRRSFLRANVIEPHPFPHFRNSFHCVVCTMIQRIKVTTPLHSLTSSFCRAPFSYEVSHISM